MNISTFGLLTLFKGLLIITSFSNYSHAEEHSGHGKPCKSIVEACKNAGFEKGKAKEGFGLWKDCVHPIVRGESQKKSATKPLPTVSTELISACKEKSPHFGQGRSKNKDAGSESGK